MGQITIRPARTGEGAALTALCKRSKAHWGYDAEFMKLSAASLTVSDAEIARGRVLVAENVDRIAGMAAVAPLPSPGEFDLDKLFVDPSALRDGLGRALFEAAANRARGEGARTLVILADPNAAAFYERLGAVRVGDAPSDSIPGRMLPLYRFAL